MGAGASAVLSGAASAGIGIASWSIVEWSIAAGSPPDSVAGSVAGLGAKGVAGDRLDVILLAGSVAFEAGFLATAFGFGVGLAGMGMVMPGID